jgi:2-keto-3-deoxy-L-fuconate dehydrogenase
LDKGENVEKNTPVCIVTGGSLGIGLAVCQTFSREGYHVVNLDLRDFEATPTRCEWKACDVSRVSDVTAAIDDIVAAYGRVDALVCNAGKHVSATIEETD